MGVSECLMWGEIARTRDIWTGQPTISYCLFCNQLRFSIMVNVNPPIKKETTTQFKAKFEATFN